MRPYRALESAQIVTTARTLESRIRERFPESGLSRVAAETLLVAQEAMHRIDVLRRPRWGLRIATGALIALIVLGLVFAGTRLRFPLSVVEAGPFVQTLESAINDLVFLGIAIAFLVTVEERLRRRAALRALHELRSLVHIVDMHQLTKDPDQFRSALADTASSPRRVLTPFQLTRYLDYCSEMLSILGKVAALYAQRLDDPVVLAAVGEVETLTAGLSNKIWQKILILGTSAQSPALPASLP